MNDNQIEQEILSNGLTAPRVTSKDIEDNILWCHCFTAAEGLAGREVAPLTGELVVHKSLHLLTICVLVLKNGFTVTGESACASPEIGRQIARQNAVNKVWPLMGYELKQRLSEGTK